MILLLLLSFLINKDLIWLAIMQCGDSMELKLRWKRIFTMAIPDHPSCSTVPATGMLGSQRHTGHSNDPNGEVGKSLSSGYFSIDFRKWKKDKSIEICWV